MRVQINKRFLKDLANIPGKDRRRVETLVFDTSDKLESLESAGLFEKLEGYQNYYCVRIGNYRVGVKYENEILTFQRVLHRKEIYRYFP